MRSVQVVAAVVFFVAAGPLACEGEEYVPPPLQTDPIFFEPFQGDTWKSRWVYSDSGEYQGRFELQTYPVDAIPGDTGLAMSEKARRYGLTATLKDQVQTSEQPLAVQYEVIHKAGLDCGGAYLKLLNVDTTFDGKQLEEPTPYSIMFGPDRCGNPGKVHFIIKFKNPTSGTWVEHHLKNGPELPPTADKLAMTHLYRFALLGGSKFSVTVDDKTTTFDLLSDLDPPINPPKVIDDPSDTKPEDWVDEAEIPDPEASKPDDWDEDAPPDIPDPSVRSDDALNGRSTPPHPACAGAPSARCRLSSRPTGTTTSPLRSPTPRRRSPQTGMMRTTANGLPLLSPTPNVRGRLRRAWAPRGQPRP